MRQLSTATRQPDTPAEACPVCNGQDGILPDRTAHWGICDTHRLKWRMGKRRNAGVPKGQACPRLGWYLPVPVSASAIRPPSLPVLVGLALDSVLQHLWFEEEQDFEAQIPGVDGHIFADLCLLRWWRLGLLAGRLGKEGGDGA